MVSLLKAWYGDKATKENDFGYSWVPKLDDGQDCKLTAILINVFRLMLILSTSFSVRSTFERKVFEIHLRL
jgi:hypothetical protein